MAYKFLITPEAEADLAGLPMAIQQRVLKKLAFFECANDPLSFAKKITGSVDKFRFRIGDYRIIVAKKNNGEFVILLILKIGHRREIYK